MQEQWNKIIDTIWKGKKNPITSPTAPTLLTFHFHKLLRGEMMLIEPTTRKWSTPQIQLMSKRRPSNPPSSPKNWRFLTFSFQRMTKTLATQMAKENAAPWTRNLRPPNCLGNANWMRTKTEPKQINRLRYKLAIPERELKHAQSQGSGKSWEYDETLAEHCAQIPL